MIPGIDPRVDIAFKKIFGTPAWSGLTRSLIDAVLRPAPGHHVAHLDLLNPYSEKDSLDDKLTILDIKARDERGRLFNVEMQMNLGHWLPARLLYYWAQLHGRQLIVGQQYSQLKPTVSICFLNEILFPSREGYHRVFGLLERGGDLCLTEHAEFHVVEMPKFHRELGSLQEPLDFWLYFFQNGRELDADAVPDPLARPEICQAMEILKVFSQSELERDRYENRLKASRDQYAMMEERQAMMEEHQAMMEERQAMMEERQAMMEERQAMMEERQAMMEERDKAVQERQQAERETKQSVSRRIQLCQRMLGQKPTPSDQLLVQSVDELSSLADQLERQLPAL